MPAPLQLSSPPQAPETTTSATFSERRSRHYSWAQSAATQSHSASQPASPAFSVRAVLASCRLTQLRCRVAPSPEVSSPASGLAHFLRSRSSVRLRRGHTCPLFLQGLQASVCGSDSPLLSSTAAQRPRHFLASSSQTLPGRQDTAVPAVGTDSVSHRRSVRQHTPPPRIRAARHRLCRFTPRITIVAKYLNS